MVSKVEDPLEAIVCRCFSPKGERNARIKTGVFAGYTGWIIADVTGEFPHVCIRLEFMRQPMNVRAEPGDWEAI